MKAAKTATVKISHRSLGEMAVKIDAEDKDLLMGRGVTVDTLGGAQLPKVRVNMNGNREYAARVILEKHGILDSMKNVFFKDNNPMNLTKKNLFQTA